MSSIKSGGQTRGLTIAGWVIAGLIAALMLFSGVMKLVNPPELAKNFEGQFGYPIGLAKWLGVTELCCLAVFLWPRTAVLGAVLLTGYLGGAVATHVRVHDVFVVPLLAGMLVWGSLFLRDGRIRALLPFRKA